MTDQPALRTTATAAYRLFDEGDVSGVDDLYSPDLVDHNPVVGASSAIEGMRTMVGWTRDGFTNPHHEILYQAVIDDEHVVTQWRMTGRQTGPFLGTEATGRDLTFVGTDIVRIVDGRITELRHVEDLFGAHAQMTQ
jgi:predicted ester cyclase